MGYIMHTKDGYKENILFNIYRLLLLLLIIEYCYYYY